MLAASPQTAARLNRDVGPLKAKLDDRTSAAVQARAVQAREMLKELDTIPRSSLGPRERTELDACSWMLRAEAGAADLPMVVEPTDPYVVSQMGGAHWSVPHLLIEQHQISDRQDAEAYLQRLSAYAAVLDQESVRAEQDAAHAFRPPTFVLDKALGQLAAQGAEDAASAPVILSFAEKLKKAGLQPALADQARAIRDEQVRPALLRQQAALKRIRRDADDDAGLTTRLAGERIYALALSKTVTTAATAADLHQLGLDRVRSLSSEIDAALRKRGLTKGSVADRLRTLFREPRFQYPASDVGRERILADLRERLAAIKTFLPQITNHSLPSIEIRRLAQAEEVGAPYGWYNPASPDGGRPGVFFINLRNPEELPRWTLPTLVYHEAIPGHHIDNSTQHQFPISTLRKVFWFSAYDEGWAMYGEQLAEEFGLYADDPFGRIGYLQDVLFRAVRLVVDTGIHALGWRREEAIGYYLSYLGKARSLAETEIDRYCVMPGQACSYLVGKESWLQARSTYRTAVGGAFSLPRFHDTLLANGQVPIGMLGDLAIRAATRGA